MIRAKNLSFLEEKFANSEFICIFASAKRAQMAESVDALVSNTSGAIHPGSIPGLGTKMERSLLLSFFRLYTLVYIHIYPCISTHLHPIISPIPRKRLQRFI